MSCSIFHWLLACIWVIFVYILHHFRDSMAVKESYGCKTTVSVHPWCLSIFLFLFWYIIHACKLQIRVVAMTDCSICSNRCTLWFYCCIMSLWAWSFLSACPSLHLLSFVGYVWPVVTLLGHITWHISSSQFMPDLKQNVSDVPVKYTEGQIRSFQVTFECARRWVYSENVPEIGNYKQTVNECQNLSLDTIWRSG